MGKKDGGKGGCKAPGSGSMRASPYFPSQGAGGWNSITQTGKAMIGYKGAKVNGKAAGKGGKNFGQTILELKRDLQAASKLPGGTFDSWDPEAEIFVGSLPRDASNEDVYEIFAPFGAIPCRGVKAMTHADGSGKGVAFVNFIEPESAQAAIEALDGHPMPSGRKLEVRLKNKKS